jgi:hypothetical protein
MAQTLVFFRNDDVNKIEPGLVEVTDALNQLGAPITHAVEPANLQDECRQFLLDSSLSDVEIIQHGFSHKRHDIGEFGGRRSRSDQMKDLREGREIMQDSFHDRFFPAMSFPFGSYNEFTIPILEELGYPVVSCHWRHQRSRQVFYRLGRLLGKGRWLGRHVSHDLRKYPGTQVLEISVTISPISRYMPAEGATACEFHSLETLQKMFVACRRISPVVGIVLHHRFRASDSALEDLRAFVAWIKSQPETEFCTLRNVYDRLVQDKNLSES